jgi:hypothetical protein
VGRVLVARSLAAASAALAVAVPVIGGVLVPEHSHVRDFISELGAVGTAWGGVVSLGGFQPTGLASLLFLIVAAPLVDPRGGAKAGYLLLSSVGIAYVGAAFAPCDIGCPAFPTSIRQLLHNLLGAVEYVGGGIGLLIFASTYFTRRPDRIAQRLLLAAGIVVLGAFQGVVTPGFEQWHGLIQRAGETALFGSLVLIGWRLARPSVT